MKIYRSRKTKAFQLVDVTPMADIVFLLLIFFMLSSTFVIQPGINIRLPKAQTASIQPEEKIIVSISKDNNVYINDRRVRMDNLLGELKMSLGGRKDKLLVLKADERVSHGLVVTVLDKAKQAGAEKLAVASEKVK